MRQSRAMSYSGLVALSLALAACGTGADGTETAALTKKVDGLSTEVKKSNERLAKLEGGGHKAATGAAGTAKVSGGGTGHGSSAPAQADGAPHWTYDEAAEWGDLGAEYAACKTGKAQSPIDLANVKTMGLTDIAFDYRPGAYEVVNNGHTIQANAKGAGGITVDGQRYELAQFHAHAPSEHTVNGKPADLEVHLVHKDAAGKLAVIGVLMQKGGANPALKQAWSTLPKPGETAPLAAFDASALLPGDRLSYRYDGSLTTPPCSEGVRWTVLKQATSVDPALVSAFANLFGPNARPVQPLNARPVIADASKG